MRLLFWVAAAAVLSLTYAKNTTSKAKPKRQLDNIRTPQNLQYSLVLPHSRVAHFRSLTSSRRVSNVGPTPRGGKLPPYAVQMEPVVQYSQKDPLYDPNQENLDENVNKNDIAQPKILNINGGDFHDGPSGEYGPPYGSLPTAPLYSHEPSPHYYEAPEPIIEIIIKESNETLPPPPPQPILKKKKEPVQVFYVKYSKDPYGKDKVIYEKPVPAITPPSNDEDDHHEEYVTVTPEPYYAPPQTTTLRAIIKPESEVYHSDSSVKVTFGSDQSHHHGHYRREGVSSEDREETAPRPAIAYPQQPPTQPTPPKSHEPNKNVPNNPTQYKPIHHAQSRIQYQPTFLSHEQQVPRQVPSSPPFRAQQHIPRQNPFGPSPSHSPISFGSGFPGPINTHFANSPTAVPGPLGPIFTASSRPQNSAFHARPNAPPTFASRPPHHFNGPPRNPFHPGPQRPFHVNPQPQPFFDDPKYLQENYHTITNEQVDPPKEQVLPNRQNNFNFIPRPSPVPGPSSVPFQDQHRPQHIPTNQQLPQQRPPQQFSDTHSKPAFSVGPSRPPFFNLKPSPPHIEQNAASTFQQHQSQQSQFSFHQGGNSQLLSRPSPQTLSNNQHNFHASPSPVPQTTLKSQFLPQPSSPPQFNFHPQPSPTPDRPNFHGPSEKPQQFNQQRPHQQNNFQEQLNHPSQHNLGQFVPNGGELVAAIPKYEQHITVNNPTAQPDYSGLTGQNSQHKQPTPTASNIAEQQYGHNQAHQQSQHAHQQTQQQNYFDNEQEQVRLQLAQNVQKQQDEINRLQAQLAYAQQQQQHQQQHQQQQQQHQQQQQQNLYEQNYKQYQQQFVSSPKPQYIQERARPHSTIYPSSTSSPPYYQSTSRTVEIKPTTQKYVSSTINSISTTPESKKQEKKKKPTIELPDEVPDDLRQQLLSSGILDNADISVLDYDKVGDTPLDSLPPDQLANFFSAGGGQQLASSEFRPIVVKPNGDKIESRIDEEEEDQEISASENVVNYITAPPSKKQDVEMKVVHFDPDTMEGQNIAKEYVKEDATRLDTVALNDKKYNRYLPLKVSGNQFPLPDILKGRQVTSVVVLAPVETESLSNDHSRSERATSNNLKGIKFVAGDSLYDLLKRPTKENFEKWLDTEKKTATDQQSVILLVTAKDDTASEKEIYMYDIGSGKVNKLSGELSSAFVEAAENNSLSKDIEQLAIEGDGTPENFNKNDELLTDGSENVPLFVDVSGLSLNQDNQISISSGYSKTKLGRSLRH